MTRTHGWWTRGERLLAKVPHGHWKTMTFLAALRHDQITAPFVLDGPINGESFAAYVQHILVPTLRPGDIVIMDNLGSHKGDAVRKAIRAAGAHLVFLPAYSPDLNPIDAVAQGRPAHHRRRLALHRSIAPPLHSRRMQQLLPQRWIPFHLSRKRFRWT